MTKKIVASAGALAAIMALVTGITYAGLNTRTESVINNFQGACVNIGVVENDINNNTVLSEDAGTKDNGSYDESKNYNVNIYERISDDERKIIKKAAIKNITSTDYPTTDTLVRVRFVPSLVYDDNEINRMSGVAGQTVPLDIRDKVEYIFADDVVSYESYIAQMSALDDSKDSNNNSGKDKDKQNAADNGKNAAKTYESKKWVYTDSSTNDINDRYYYYMSPLAPDEVSEILLDAVVYKGELPDNTHFELRVLSEGIAKAQLEYL